jgi:hypothetical protein
MIPAWRAFVWNENCLSDGGAEPKGVAMKITVQPGKRIASPKEIFDQPVGSADVKSSPTGDVILTIVTADIYTPRATRRFAITFSKQEVDMILDAIGGL